MEDKLDFEPAGTIPKVGDYVVCFGDSSWREEGKQYRVIAECYPDFVTEDGHGGEGYWCRTYFAPLPEDPKVYISRYYRVVKRPTETTHDQEKK